MEFKGENNKIMMIDFLLKFMNWEFISLEKYVMKPIIKTLKDNLENENNGERERMLRSSHHHACVYK